MMSLGVLQVKSGSHLKEANMANRVYPSYWMYRDNRGEWRWSYEASNAKTIAVSSEGYVRRADCERSIEIMKQSANSPVWLPENLLNVA